MTYKDFVGKRTFSGEKRAAENIPGIAKRGALIKGNCDNLEVVRYLGKRIAGVDTKIIYLKQAK